MNFADAHALKVLPEKIAAAELEIAALEASLSEDGLYAKTPSDSPSYRTSWPRSAPRKTLTRNAG
jgi:hypothetical protein